jgi:hypothetical protein
MTAEQHFLDDPGLDGFSAGARAQKTLSPHACNLLGSTPDWRGRILDGRALYSRGYGLGGS